MEQQSKPSQISFTPEDVAKAASRPKLNEGWYQFLITDAETGVSANGHLMLVTRCAPLAEPGNADSKVSKLSVRNNIVLPFRNPDKEDHTAPNTGGIVLAMCHALWPDECPDIPRVVDGTLTYKGEPIEKVDEQEYAQEAMQAAFEKAMELWNDPQLLVDQAFYGLAFQNGDFTNLKTVRGELPSDAELVPSNAFEQAIEVKAKSNGNGKTAAKPAGKAAASNGKKKR